MKHSLFLFLIFFIHSCNELKVEPIKTPMATKSNVKLEKSYQLGMSLLEQRKYIESKQEFEKVKSVDPHYRLVDKFIELTQSSYQQEETIKAELLAAQYKLDEKVDVLLPKAREALQNKQLQVAENYLWKIINKDPENLEGAKLKIELDRLQEEK